MDGTWEVSGLVTSEDEGKELGANLLDINPVEGRISFPYGDSTCGSLQAKT